MKTIALIGLLIVLLLPRTGLAAGTTVITHGLSGDTDGWVSSMTDRITRYPNFPGTNFTIYKIFFVKVGSFYYLDWERSAGDAATNTLGGEIVVKFDWRQLANNDYSTYQLAGQLADSLTSTNFIPELGGHALAELPLHLIGHSRGGSLVCETSRLLGSKGVWVDQVTTLDPHPLNDPEFPQDILRYSVMDAPALAYENVLFHDNYYQTINLITPGLAVPGAFRRKLLSLDGGYEGGLTDSHSDAHLWYHGTIDLRPFAGGPGPASDSEAFLGSTERQSWYSSAELQGIFAGFYYSRMGGGDRLSTNRPFGTPGDAIRSGMNQLWDFGAGQSFNRVRLTNNAGAWPNLMKLNVTTTNLIAYGQSVSVKAFYHWATNVVRSGTIGFYSDDDLNPLNSNSRLIREFSFNSQGPDNIGISTAPLTIDSTNSPAGQHAIYAKITGGGRCRYLYAPEILNVVSSFAQPTLDVVRSGNQVTVGVNGVAGQIVILDSAPSIGSWSPMVTNRLSTNRWTVPYTIPAGSGSQFFRARLGP